jgi:hypothetical protein
VLGFEISRKIIDLNKIFPEEGINSQEITNLENYAIYYFMLKEVIPEILRIKPEDHLKVEGDASYLSTVLTIR